MFFLLVLLQVFPSFQLLSLFTTFFVSLVTQQTNKLTCVCVFCVVQLTCFPPWIKASLRTAAWPRHLQASGALVCVQRGPSLQASRTGGHPGSVLAHMQSLSAVGGPLLAERVSLPPPPKQPAVKF